MLLTLNALRPLRLACLPAFRLSSFPAFRLSSLPACQLPGLPACQPSVISSQSSAVGPLHAFTHLRIHALRFFLPSCQLSVLYLFLCLSLTTPAFAAEAPKTEEQKTLYAIGLSVGRTLAPFSLTPAELEIVKQGITDSVTGKKPGIELSAYNNKIQEMARARRKAQGDKMAPQNKAALDKASAEKGAVKTASGLVYVPLKEGAGTSPTAADTVRVNYRGTLPDGKEFDSSAKQGKPLEFKLDKVIKCWTEGLQLMKPGGKAKLVCPASIAYGDIGAGDLILPGATLIFEIELLEVKK
ncbi:MAG: FKBP-type peptidyl-prolyl cis-trans isomerase [Nitrospirae bacterium]|nr:FKBP-type peptidyl-prolyl cis-trans isomerase [Nitrospirota bacterium]